MSKILPSEWEAPEHISLSEREFLVDRAETINGIIAASYLQVGQVLLQVKKKFKSDPELNGWFRRWCNETLPFKYETAAKYMSLATAAQENPIIAELSQKQPWSKLYAASTLPAEFRAQMLSLLQSGEDLTVRDMNAIATTPEAELAKAKECVEALEATLLRYELTGSKNQNAQRKRIAKAMQQLQEKQAAVDSLEKTRSTQELVLLQLRKQLNQKQVFIENLTVDPNQNRQRDLARTVVDATRALDMLLASFDRYSTDKTELGAQAIETIERKMDEVKSKLLEHYGSTTT